MVHAVDGPSAFHPRVRASSMYMIYNIYYIVVGIAMDYMCELFT